eukprot:CCRYP_003263-RA/>CCRYP_003263-RA protein AED:0.01 eAED:0.01 QI:1784/1/1/1/1/1/4/343/1697
MFMWAIRRKNTVVGPRSITDTNITTYFTTDYNTVRRYHTTHFTQACQAETSRQSSSPTTTTMSTPLPTLDECTSILSNILSHSDRSTSLTSWRKTIHRSLAHACLDEESNVESSSTQLADSTARLLGDALHWYLTQPGDSRLPSGEDDVIGAVVESIWLVGCLLDDSSPGYKCLIDIVSRLTQRRVVNDPNDQEERPLLPPELLQTSLEFSLLQDANLLPAASTTTAPSKQPVKKKDDATPSTIGPALASAKQKYMKVNANLYYRQHKFNIFAEESEGWAKLLGFLVRAGPRFLVEDGTEEGETEHVRSLIGAFDLDPNRVLDVALDALEWELNGVILKHVRGVSTTTNTTNTTTTTAATSFADMRNMDENALWGLGAIRSCVRKFNENSRISSLLSIIRELDGTNSEGRAVAHLLGFKYRSYYHRAMAAKSPSAANAAAAAAVPGVGNIYPPSLFVSTAFLSLHGVVDVHALLPHLLPLAEKEKKSMMDMYQTFCVETVSRLKKMGVISLNAKSSNRDETSAASSDERTSDPFPNDPIVGIFRALLAVMGNWDDAVGFLAHASLSGFADVVSTGDVSKLKKAMNSVALAACSLSDVVALDVCAWVSCVVEGVLGDHDKASRPVLLPSGQCSWEVDRDSPLEDLSAVLLAPLSCLVGSGKIRLSQQLYMKLCGLYRSKLAAMQRTEDDSTREVDESSIDGNTFAVLSTCLVPSLSLFPSDPSLPRELWSVLQLLPYIIRYKLYASWRSPSLEKGALRSMSAQDVKAGNFPKPLHCIESEIQTGIETRSIVKRISKDNIKEKGPDLSKASHNNPLVVFSYILNQIESYDNMILMMVDTFQFVTALGLDVIGYCLLLSLGGGDDGSGKRSRTKVGGLNTEQWLTSLETLTGAFYKRFPDVELRGLLFYLVERLKAGEASELGVLRSLIKTAGGYGFVDYDSTSALSELQLDGRCGSRLLKLETSSFGVIDDVNPRASRTLRNVLQRGDLGVIMLILLSQIRQQILYSKSESKEHIKVIGSMYDNCESVLCLLLEYVSDSSDDLPTGPSTKEKFANSMPPLGSLCDTFGLDTATAWMLIRPLVRKSMFYMDDKKLVGKSSTGEPPAFLKPFTPTPEMTRSYRNLLPECAWKHISPALFEAFFSFSIYDIQCPTERYNIEINRLKKDVERLTQLQKGGSEARGHIAAMAAAAAAAGGNEDAIRRATKFTETHEIELDRLKRNVEQLSKDFLRQQKRCDLVRAKLEAQKDSLINPSDTEEEGSGGNFASAFLTFCIYPRALSSPEDSLFCAHFVKLLHKMKLPSFPTIQLIDSIVNAATGSFYCITEDEAGNLAIFLHEIWKSVNSWRYDNDSFASELKDTPGSRVTKFFALEKNIDPSISNGITHDDYKAIYSQWHLKIGSAAIGCLNSSEYMHTRSALIVLSRIVLVYPTQPTVGEKILDTLASLQKDESRPDIRATAQGYASQLMKARDEGMWKEENIAVTKARQEREQMKVEERRKKLAQQHEEMKKESEMISRELGDNTWRRGGRDDNRGRPWGNDTRTNNQMGPPLNPHGATFTPREGGEIRELNSTTQRRDGHDHSRPIDSRRAGPDRDMWERDRSSVQASGRHVDTRGYSSRPTSHAGPSDAHDNRRHGDDAGGPRRKRSRSPEPGEDTERDNSMQKRFKQVARSNSPPRGSRNAESQQSSRDRRDRRSGTGRH